MKIHLELDIAEAWVIAEAIDRAKEYGLVLDGWEQAKIDLLDHARSKIVDEVDQLPNQLPSD